MRAVYLRAIVAALLLVAWGPAQANLQTGLDALKGGDYAVAEKEFRQLAEYGDAAAQYQLGLMYDYGQGVARNDALALQWYRRAALQGHEKAQFRVGAMYDSGQGVRQNFKVALGWYRKAAQQGNVDAQNNLGVMYSRGQGVRADRVQAYMWFSVAAAAGSEVAARNKSTLEVEMTPQQIEAAQALVADWANQQK